MRKTLTLAIFLLTTPCFAQQATVVQPSVKGPTSAVSGHLATFSGTSGQVIQDGGVIPGTATNYFQLSYSGSGTISGSNTRIPMDTKDTDPNTWCDIVTNVGRCTPLVAGTYYVYCYDQMTATTGPGVSGVILSTSIMKNGSVIKQTITRAEVAAIVAPIANSTASALIAVNGSTDYIECGALSGATSPTYLGTNQANYFGAAYIGP